MKYQINSFRNRSVKRLLAVFTLTILTSLLVLTSGKTAPLGESTRKIEIEPECQDGAVGICTLNGKPGKRTCFNGHWGACETEDSTRITAAGTIRPKYYILSVIYAPPGTNGGNSQSSVTYGKESSMGSTVSATKSFKENYGVSLTVEGNSGFASGKLGASFEVRRKSSDSNSLEIKKTGGITLSTSGANADGINHDDDVIYLWLNPTIDVAVTPTSVDCALRTDKTVADIQFAYVGWLKNPAQIPKGLRDRFDLYGITEQDFPEMLKADPFATGSGKIDPNRFQIVGETFPYEPPSPNGATLPKQMELKYSTAATNSSTVENETKVGVTAEAGVGTPVLKATLKFDESWAWTTKDTRATDAGTLEKASATVGGPASGYTGLTDVAVYYDVLYKTFMFAFVEGKLDAFHGNVRDALGKPVSWKQVVVTSQGKRYSTYTNANGDYRIFGQISGPVRIRVGKTIRRLRRVPATRTIPVKLRA